MKYLTFVIGVREVRKAEEKGVLWGQDFESKSVPRNGNARNGGAAAAKRVAMTTLVELW